jgi:glycosyltransferase involved in cell wall biosynthesis
MREYRPDYVVDGETGFLAESDEDLEQKLDLLLTHPELRRTMAEAAIIHARKFDWDEIACQWEAVFEAVVAEGRRL